MRRGVGERGSERGEREREGEERERGRVRGGEEKGRRERELCQMRTSKVDIQLTQDNFPFLKLN